jgi:hypothetical protein
MKCTACGEYIYKGRKFNARKETTDEKYLKIQIFRFYIRCTRCSAEITFKTDPKNMDYTCERGAKRNTEPWRDTAKMEEVNETENELQERNAMEELEQRMMDSKREVQVADALDEIRVRNARIERGERGGKEEVALASVKDTMEEERLRAEREDEEAARRAFAEAKPQQEQLDQRIEINEETITSMPDSMSMPPPPLPTFERKKIVKKPVTPGLVKVKKAEPQPAAPAPSLGLADYGSDSD